MMYSASKRSVLRKLNVDEVLCPVCRGIFIEPVTLPCHHVFCLQCLEKTVENNAFACPVCRCWIGSFLRLAKNRSKIINHKLWDQVKKQFPKEIERKRNGEEDGISGKIMAAQTMSSLPSSCGEIKQEFDELLHKLKIEEEISRRAEQAASEKLIRKLMEEDYEEERARKEIAAKDVLFIQNLLKAESPMLVDSTSHDDELDENFGGRDSISVEFRHFTPICIAPKTPPKILPNGQQKVTKLVKPKNLSGSGCWGRRKSYEGSQSLKNKKNLKICSNNFKRTKCLSLGASAVPSVAPDTTTNFPQHLIESREDIQRRIHQEKQDLSLAIKFHDKCNKEKAVFKRQHGYSLRSAKSKQDR